MNSSKPSFQSIDNLIHQMDTAIRNNAVNDGLLKNLQHSLDTLDSHYKDDAAVRDEYHKMFELQALIYGSKNKDIESQQFMDEAVRIAGGSDRLSSSVLREYYLREPIQAKQSPLAPFMKPIKYVCLAIFVLFTVAFITSGFRIGGLFWVALFGFLTYRADKAIPRKK